MINRKAWSYNFTAGVQDTPWPCPSCATGHLRIVAGSISSFVAAESHGISGELWWEPPMEKGRFIGAARCTQSSCGETVALAGITKVIEIPDGHFEVEQFERFHQVTFMDPPPRLINIPESVPKPVQDLLHDVCRLVWLDPAASGNRGRAAVEQLLTELRIPKRTRSKKGKLVRLDLSERIERFSEKKPDLATKLTAIRWLGNVGSHSKVTTTESVMDGLDVFAYVLDELYLDRRGKIGRVAKRLTSRKGRP